MKLPTWIAALLSALAALLPGCDMVNLPKIKPGITTAAEVRSSMGEPGTIHWNNDGTATWEYSRQPSGVECYMISFDRSQIVSAVEQVLTDSTYAKVGKGLSKDDVLRLLGQPATKTPFENLGEEIWSWHITGELPGEETYFDVHFDLRHGAVNKAGKRVEQRGG